ncbi:hypothetical protein [Burkholderia ubonensis]|uniref:hypothetical protein n=1 Tax=Burkholderia ubonensis TaxID=101571 RepID=UPI000B0381BC|nr:hypothetical protein [Burkholderia ubonensis]
MKNFRVATVVSVIFPMLIGDMVFGQDRPLMVGNAIDEVSNVDGPAWVQVDLSGCQFSMKIDHGGHVKYNGPDFVFYRSNYPVGDLDLPYLKQAEMSSGYDWWFEQPKNEKLPWMGLMCESSSSFRWSSNPAKADISPEFQSVMDSNSLRCPADFDGEKWAMREGEGARFVELNVAGGRGFVIGDNMGSGSRGARFCFINGVNVLIGVSGGGIGIGEDAGGGGSIINLLKGIEFKLDNGPVKW